MEIQSNTPQDDFAFVMPDFGSDVIETTAPVFNEVLLDTPVPTPEPVVETVDTPVVEVTPEPVIETPAPAVNPDDIDWADESAWSDKPAEPAPATPSDATNVLQELAKSFNLNAEEVTDIASFQKAFEKAVELATGLQGDPEYSSYKELLDANVWSDQDIALNEYKEILREKLGLDGEELDEKAEADLETMEAKNPNVAKDIADKVRARAQAAIESKEKAFEAKQQEKVATEQKKVDEYKQLVETYKTNHRNNLAQIELDGRKLPDAAVDKILTMILDPEVQGTISNDTEVLLFGMAKHYGDKTPALAKFRDMYMKQIGDKAVSEYVKNKIFNATPVIGTGGVPTSKEAPISYVTSPFN